MCDKAVKDDPPSLQFVPDWFHTQQQIDVWYDDDYCCHDDEIIEWYNGYKKRRAHEAKIKEEYLLALIPDHLKTQEISKEVVQKDAYTLGDVPDHFKIQETCNKVVEVDP